MKAKPIPVGEEPDALAARPAPHTHKAMQRKAPDRFTTLNTFVDFTMASLSRAEVAVWFVLYRDTRDGAARTAMRDIATRAGCALRNVVRAMALLEEKGLVQVVRRGGFGRGPSTYRIVPLTK